MAVRRGLTLDSSGYSSIRFSRRRCSAPGVRAAERVETVGGPAWQLPAALLFGAAVSQVVAAIVLALAAPDLAHGLFFGPQDLELVHLYGLGTLTVAIFAVLLQMLPVILRQRVPLEWLAAAAVAGVLAGAWLMALGLGRNQTGLAGLGGSLLGVGGITLIILVAAALVRAARAGSLGDTGWGIAVALGWFTVVIGLGGSLLDNLRTPVLGGLTLRVLAAHALIAGLGWIGGMVLAIVLRLGPMLALAHGHSQRPGRIALTVWHAGVAGLAVGLVINSRALAMAGSLLLTLAVVALTLYLAGVIRHRNRRLEAPTVHLALGAACLFVAVVAIGGAASGLWSVFEVVIPVGLCVLVGFGAGATSGHLFKVLPMIVWTGRFAGLAGTGMAPRLADMYPARLARTEQIAFTAGVVCVLGGVLYHAPLLTSAGAWLIVLAAALTLTGASTIITRTPRIVRTSQSAAAGSARHAAAPPHSVRISDTRSSDA